jgi:subtilisin family serine protease
MSRILKVFVSGEEQEKVITTYHVIEQYDGFIIIEVADNAVKAAAKKYLVEDITDLYTIHIGQKALDTSKPRFTTAGKQVSHPFYKGNDNKALSAGPHHYLVQFNGPIKAEWLKGVKKTGAELRDPYGDFNYIVKADEAQLTKIAALPYVRWLGHLPYTDRIERTVMDTIDRADDDPCSVLPRTRIMPGVYVVEFFMADDVENATKEIRKLGFTILDTNQKGKVLIVETKLPRSKREKQIKDLSAVHGVRKIRERAIKRPSNNVAAGIMGTALTAGIGSGSGLGLSGKGEIIGICDTGIDTGDVLNINDDFKGRIVALNSYPITPDYDADIKNPGGNDGPADLDSGHGTHVAGSVLGDGTNSAGIAGLPAPIRGLAYKAKLVFQAVEQEMKWKSPDDLKNFGRYILAGIPADIRTIFSYAYQKGARIHSNSWGGGKPGEYDAQCRQLDQFVWDNKDFCILVAAGNDGSDHDGDGKINLMSVTSPGTAKNCITVGACENKRLNFNGETYGAWWPSDDPVAPFKNAPIADNPDQVVAFSSRGPCRDNRIKPDVVAPGTFILSTRSSMIASNNKGWASFPQSSKYFYMGGTSMATPLTTGAVALVREYLRTKQSFTAPSAALLKATLIAGAVKLPGMVPAGAFADNHQGFGRVNIDNVLVPKAPATCNFIDNTAGLATGAVFSKAITIKSSAVTLRIVMAYSDFPGTKLINNLNLILTAPNGKKYVGNQNSTGPITIDATNNVEVVEVMKPDVGQWKIEVVCSNIPNGPQPFALVYLGHVS